MNMSRCDENAKCSNTDGSYNCSCNDGYQGDGFNCTGNESIFVNILREESQSPVNMNLHCLDDYYRGILSRNHFN